MTVTLPQQLADELARFAAGGEHGGNVSAVVTAAVQEKLERDRTLARLSDLWGEVDDGLVARAEASLRSGPAGPGGAGGAAAGPSGPSASVEPSGGATA